MTSSPAIKWSRIFAIIPSASMAFMDQSILPVALPDIQKELSASANELQWTINAYILVWAVFVLAGGKLSDRIGHKKTYLSGIVLFTIFSVLCGLSPNIEMLIGARAFQGLGAAIMFPAQTALIAFSFPPLARGRAIGMMVSVGSIFLVLGPMIGGFLTEHFSWNWIFWINIPIAIIGFCLSLFLLPSPKGGKGKLDRPGFIYFAIFASSIIIFFMQANIWGWDSVKIISLGIIAALSLLFLIRREKRADHAFLELKMFRLPSFAAINTSISIMQFILMITVFRTIYTEEILNYTPLQTGFIISVSSLPMLFCSYIAGFLADKVSPRLPITTGYILIIFSFFWLGFFPIPTLAEYIFPLCLFGIGAPFIFTPSYSLVMSNLPSEKVGVAMGMVSTLRMLAASMGLALIYLFIDTRQASLLPTVGYREAVIDSFSSVHFFLGALMIIAFLLNIFLYKGKSAHRLPDAPSDGWD